jgi:hypothetical protein
MPVNDYGFLGKDIKQYENKLMIKYKEVFDFYEEFNDYLHKMKCRINVEKNDFQGGIVIGLFSKSLTTFQAIYILFKHYLCNTAEELCRILFVQRSCAGYYLRKWLILGTVVWAKMRLEDIYPYKQ